MKPLCRLSFKEAQRILTKDEDREFRCLATWKEGGKYKHCDEPIKYEQKARIRGILQRDNSRLTVDDIRAIIWEVLCAYHQDRTCYYEKRIEEKWRHEFPGLEFSVRRNKRRRSSLSRSPTPESRSPLSTAPSAPSTPTPSTPAHTRASQDVDGLSLSNSDVANESVVESIEPHEPDSIATRMADTPDVEESQSQFSRDSAQSASLDFERKKFSHSFGDSSDVVSVEVSSRTKYILHGENGEVRKVDSRQEATSEHEVEDQTPEQGRPSTPRSQTSAVPMDGADERERLSLSPEQFAKGRSQVRYRGSRPPTPGLTSDEAKNRFATMAGDAAYDKPVYSNVENVIKLLQKPLAYQDSESLGRPGWVYAIRAHELDLVKIGLSRQDPGQKRLGNIISKCKLTSARIVDNPNQDPVLAYKRLEQLIHEDLRPHRWYWECPCGRKRGTKDTVHHEWYELPDRVVIDTINLWMDFIRQDPYGQIFELRDYKLQDQWIQKVMNRTSVTKDEEHFDHNLRLARWRTLLLGESTIENYPSVVPAPSIPTTETKTDDTEDVKIKAEPEDEEPEDEEPEDEEPEDEEPEDEEQNASIYHNPPAAEITSKSPPLPSLADPSPELLLNDDLHPSFPTTAATSRSNSRDANEQHMAVRPTLSRTEEKTRHYEQHPPTPPHSQPNGSNANTTASTEQNNIGSKDFATQDLKLPDLLGRLDTFLRKERKGLPTRSAYDDMYTFRWPLTSAFILALYSSYVPPVLSALTWVVFLQFFVAELREWT